MSVVCLLRFKRSVFAVSPRGQDGPPGRTRTYTVRLLEPMTLPLVYERKMGADEGVEPSELGL